MMPRLVQLLAVVIAVGVAALSDCTQAACSSVPFVTIPSDYGLDKCVGNNVWDLVGSVAGSSSKCSVFKLTDLSKSESLTKMTSVLRQIVASPDKLSTILYDTMKASSEAQIDAFCTDWSKLLAPCADVFIPKLLKIINNDVECCGQLSDFVDLLNLIVPPTVSKESFLLTEVVNGLNNFVCARRADTKQTCGASIFQQLTTKYSADNFRVVESFLLPFVSASSGHECDAFQGKPFTSSLSLASATAIDYSCCVDHIRPLLESVQQAFTFVVSNSPLEFLNGIVEFPTKNATAKGTTKLQFVDALQAVKTSGCTYKTTCSAPSGLTSYATRTITPGTNGPKKNELRETTCAKAKWCDASGSTCSEVCAKGSVTLPKWVGQSLAYQRQLAYSGPLCFAQLPATHNSAITLADGFGNRDQLMNLNLDAKKPYSYMKTNNHMLSMTDQLRTGVRWLEVDVHYFLQDLRTAHCGNMGSNSIQVLAATLTAQLAKYGTVNWGPELLGCFPSLSGIKAEEQPTTRASMEEIRAWLDQPENENELVVVYMDTGSELKTLGKFPALNKLLTDVFGDLIVPIAEWDALQKANWTGSKASLQHFIDQGRRVVLLANDNTGLAYKMRDFCKGHEILATEYIDAVPDASRVLGGKKIYSTEYFLRSYQSVLRYISLSDGGTISQALPVQLMSSNIHKFVRWNVNLVATDALDGSMVKPQIWSWAENEPATTNANATVYLTNEGRWRASTSVAKTMKACWNALTLQWSVVAYAEACAEGSTFAKPTNAYENYLLLQEITAKKITDAVSINL